MLNRHRLGSNSKLSLTQKFLKWLVDIISRILFAAFATAVLYLFFTYVVLSIINFLSIRVLEAGPIDENNKFFLASMIIIIGLVDIRILKKR
jgi:hypothetical protein